MIKNKEGLLIGLRILKNTDNTSKAYLGMDGILRDQLIKHWSQGVHIYLLSNEKPKLGDWVFDDEFFLNSKMEENWDAVLVYQTDVEYYRIGKEERKIINTTDPDVKKPMSKQQLKELIEIFNRQ